MIFFLSTLNGPGFFFFNFFIHVLINLRLNVGRQSIFEEDFSVTLELLW